MLPVEIDAALRAVLGPGAMVTDAAAMVPHLTDWRRTKTGHADVLLRPSSHAEVAAIVQVARAFGLALVPQGGNTGLVGGGVPEPDCGRPTAIVSLRRMARIISVDAAGLSMVVEAGAILADVHAAAEAAGVRFPLSLGAKGSATIGGLLSTNAGGTQVLRHGTMRGLVLGLRAVLPDGATLDQLGPLRKDNSGYDVKQLLIGGEGTLGIVTTVALRLAPLMRVRTVGWAGAADADHALALLARLRTGLGEQVESFELIDSETLAMVERHIAGVRRPLAGRHGCHMLLEAEAPAEALEALLAAALEAGEIEDATLAASEAQANQLWKLREDVPEAERLDGPAVKNDVSIPVADLPRFIDAVRDALAEHHPGAQPLIFGHLGDGNLHLNIRPPTGVADGRQWCRVEGEAARRLLHDIIHRFGGSISAEHGIGTLKAAELERLGDGGKLAAMRAVKQALDPANIMNPGKLGGPILASAVPAR